MDELHLYDFDATLFRSPTHPEWWADDGGWWSSLVSLSPPCVPEKPWNEQVVASARRSIADPNVFTIVCTGRLKQTYANRVTELIRDKGLNFDEVHLRDGGSTAPYKKRVIGELLARFPDITTVHIWEDRLEHLPEFIEHVEQLGKVGVPHPIQRRDPVCQLTVEQTQGMVDQGLIDESVLGRVDRVATRFVRDIIGEVRRAAQVTTRVAERWVSDEPDKPRMAGVIQAPPAMVLAVSKWVQSTVAATELKASAEGHKAFMAKVKSRKSSPLVGKIKEVRQAIAKGMKVRGLYKLYSEEQKGLFTLAHQNAPTFASEAFGGGYRLMNFKSFAAQYKQGNKWLAKVLDSFTLWSGARDGWTIRTLKNYDDREALLRSYLAPGGKKPMTKGSGSKTFLISKYMKGWRYADILKDPKAIGRSRAHHAKKRLREFEKIWARRKQRRIERGRIPMDPVDTEDYNEDKGFLEAEIAEAESLQHGLAFKEIPVTVYTHQDSRARASWNPSTYEIIIYFPQSTESWGMSGLVGSVEHELQHMAQTLLQRTFGVASAGLPKKDTLTPKFEQWMSQDEAWMKERPYERGRRDEAMQQLDEEGFIERDVGHGRKFRIPSQKIDFHALDDREFFTRLMDEIRTAKPMMADLKGKARNNAIDLYTYVLPIPQSNDKDWYEKVQALGGYDALDRVLSTPGRLFKALREVPSARKKYLRAVKEFRKALGYKGRRKVKLGAYDPESWYYALDSGLPLQTVIDRWQKQRPGKDKRGAPMPRQKVYDRTMPAQYTVRELWPHREYTWTRDKARDGFAKVKGKSVWLDGPLKWDALLEDMRQRGWDPKEPLQFYIGDQAGEKIGEGNHRLALARELGMTKVPVWFHFQTGRVRKGRMPSREPVVEVAPKAVEKAVEKAKPRTPEEEKKLSDLMSLLTGRKTANYLAEGDLNSRSFIPELSPEPLD